MLQSLGASFRHFLNRPVDIETNLDEVIRDEKRLKHCLINQAINQSNRARFWRRCVELRTHAEADELTYYNALRHITGTDNQAKDLSNNQSSNRRESQSNVQPNDRSFSYNQPTNQPTESVDPSSNPTSNPAVNQLPDAELRSLFLHGHFPVVPDFGSPVMFEHDDELYDIEPVMKELTNLPNNQTNHQYNPIKRSKQAIKHSTHSLLCLVQSTHPKLIHCPFLVDLIPFLCRYFDDSISYSLIELMIEPIHKSTSRWRKRANSVTNAKISAAQPPPVSPHASSMLNSPVNYDQSTHQPNNAAHQFDFHLSPISPRSPRSPRSPASPFIDEFQLNDDPSSSPSHSRSNNHSSDHSSSQSLNSLASASGPSAASYYFTLTTNSFANFLKKFYLQLKLDHESVKHHLKHLGIDVCTVFQSLVERLFMGFHDDLTVVRLLDGLMAFGMPWLWCWALALLDVHSTALLACMDRKQVSSLLYTTIARSDPKHITKRACQLLSRVKEANGKFPVKLIDMYTINTVHPARETAGHVPAINQMIKQSITSELCSPDIVRAVWSWLPVSHRFSEPQILYASGIHGYSARTLIARCTTPDPHTSHPPTVTVIKTETAVFGVYLSHSWVKDTDAGQIIRDLESTLSMSSPSEAIRVRDRAKHISPGVDGRCFLFTVRPQARCYRHVKAREHRQQLGKQREKELSERKTLRAQPEGLRHADETNPSTDAVDHVEDGEGVAVEPYHRPPIHQRSSTIDNQIPSDDHVASSSNNLTSKLSTNDRASFAAALQALVDADVDAELDVAVHMLCSEDQLSIGDSSGVALSLDSRLMWGVTKPCASFGKSNLSGSTAADGRFRVLAIEVWGFQPPHHVG